MVVIQWENHFNCPITAVLLSKQSKAAYVLFYFRRGSLDNEIDSTLNGSQESEPMEEDDNDNMRSSAANGSSTD